MEGRVQMPNPGISLCTAGPKPGEAPSPGTNIEPHSSQLAGPWPRVPACEVITPTLTPGLWE